MDCAAWATGTLSHYPLWLSACIWRLLAKVRCIVCDDGTDLVSSCEILLAYKKLLANNIKLLFHSVVFKKIYKFLKTDYIGQYPKMQEKPNAQGIEASGSNSAVSMGNLSVTQPPRRCYNNAHPKAALLCHVSSLSSGNLEHFSLRCWEGTKHWLWNQAALVAILALGSSQLL